MNFYLASYTFLKSKWDVHFSPIDPGSNWSDLRKQLREFTLNTQQELELERADLLTRNAMLEQEVQELNDYIDSHLARYATRQI